MREHQFSERTQNKKPPIPFMQNLMQVFYRDRRSFADYPPNILVLISESETSEDNAG